jgi:hypothetical protein
MNFESILQLDVPKGRDGKHKRIITKLLSDIEQLGPQNALKIPLSALPDSKENIRSLSTAPPTNLGLMWPRPATPNSSMSGRPERNPERRPAKRRLPPIIARH